MSHTDPFAELTRLQNELNRIFSTLLESGETPAGTLSQWDPAMDVVDAKSAVRILLEVPGVRIETIRVRARGTTIVVSGKKEPAVNQGGDRKFHCMERSFGPFTKSITLTQSINSHDGRAFLSAGVLCLEFPKVPDLRSREVDIPVRAGDEDPACTPGGQAPPPSKPRRKPTERTKK